MSDTTGDWAKRYERGVRTYAIWWNPADFPGKFVVRGATSYTDRVEVDEECELANSLKEARSKVPEGFVMIARHPSDPPGIVECWV